MNKLLLVVIASSLLTACVSQPHYRLSASSEHIKSVQTLDPGAPERNDGILNTLEGNYGNKVMSIYRKSPYEAKSARLLTQKSSVNK